MIEREPDSQQRFPTRRSYLLFALLVMAFVIYGSLIPFDFQRVTVAEAWTRFSESLAMLPARRISRSDVIANVLLFVPIGFALAGACVSDRHTSRRLSWYFALPFIIPVTLAVSLLAEFLQAFAGGRVPSGLDVAAQTVGASLGVGLWVLVGRSLTEWIRQTHTTVRGDRVARLLVAYAAAWVFVSLAPFDFTVDLGDIARGVRQGRITLIPFSGTHGSLTELVWDAAIELLSAVPLGVLAAHAMRQQKISSAMAAAGLGFVIVLAIEAIQVFVASHSANVTDLMSGWVGIALGVAIASRVLPGRTTLEAAAPRTDVLLVTLGVVTATALIAAYYWQPYDFAVDNRMIRGKLARMSLVPFAAHLSGSYLTTFSTLLVDLALAGGWGFGFGVLLSRLAISLRLAAAATIVLAGALFAIIEIGQLFLPTRIPDPTDVIIGMLAAFAGFRLAHWAGALRESTIS